MSNRRATIALLAADGLPAAAIARRLGLAGPTVDYHLARLRAGDPDSPGTRAAFEASAAVTRVATREHVAELLARGLSRAEIARRLGITKGTVSYHARRLGAPVDERGARRYDWAAVQRHYDAGRSVRECQAHFGFSRAAWHDAVRRGAIQPRQQALSIEELFSPARPRGRTNLKRRLIAEGLKIASCEGCGLTAWRGRPLTLSLHHVNGDRHDNRLENLELLCPNCHSQTPNFAGRNGVMGRPPVLPNTATASTVPLQAVTGTAASAQPRSRPPSRHAG